MTATHHTFTSVLIALLLVNLTGCALANSKLHEYRETAEQLGTELEALVPAELTDNEPTIEGDIREHEQHGPGGKQSSPAYWRLYYNFPLITEPGSSEQAAKVLHDHLVADDWNYSRTRTSAGETHFFEGYRKQDEGGDQWYVEISWGESEPEGIGALSVLIVSPTTTLGDDPPQREFSHPDL